MFIDSFLGDANRQFSDLKFKLVKSEQEITALEQNVSDLWIFVYLFFCLYCYESAVFSWGQLYLTSDHKLINLYSNITL